MTELFNTFWKEKKTFFLKHWHWILSLSKIWFKIIFNSPSNIGHLYIRKVLLIWQNICTQKYCSLSWTMIIFHVITISNYFNWWLIIFISHLQVPSKSVYWISIMYHTYQILCWILNKRLQILRVCVCAHACGPTCVLPVSPIFYLLSCPTWATSYSIYLEARSGFQTSYQYFLQFRHYAICFLSLQNN